MSINPSRRGRILQVERGLIAGRLRVVFRDPFFRTRQFAGSLRGLCGLTRGVFVGSLREFFDKPHLTGLGVVEQDVARAS